MFSLYATPYCAPAPVAAPDQTLKTLFRLLDDFDSYSHHQPQHRRHPIRRPVVTRTPKFDVYESDAAYHFHGELPGVSKENLNIEFTDAQTMVVRARLEHNYISKPKTQEETTTTATAEAEPATAAAEPAEEKATTDADETASNASGSSHGWHHATVEDDPEEPGTPSRASTPVDTPVQTPKKDVTKPAATPAPAVQKAPEAPKENVWLRSERSAGLFERTFTFPVRVEHENVEATLENGVLSITVPKAPKYQLRRIAIF